MISNFLMSSRQTCKSGTRCTFVFRIPNFDTIKHNVYLFWNQHTAKISELFTISLNVFECSPLISSNWLCCKAGLLFGWNNFRTQVFLNFSFFSSNGSMLVHYHLCPQPRLEQFSQHECTASRLNSGRLMYMYPPMGALVVSDHKNVVHFDNLKSHKHIKNKIHIFKSKICFSLNKNPPEAYREKLLLRVQLFLVCWMKQLYCRFVIHSKYCIMIYTSAFYL